MHPTNRIRRALVACALASLPLLLTLGHATAQTTRPAPGLTIHVAAHNAGVRVVPGHVPAGIVPFTVIDDLKGPAGALIFRANAGHTLAQAFAIFQNQKAPPGQLTRVATFVAGFTVLVPGQQLHGWVTSRRAPTPLSRADPSNRTCRRSPSPQSWPERRPRQPARPR
jgi:hypothetical protein